jgi:alkanesulfonate monooxygenase SsuD/methylene tetrahydromethanopterin reductase-like flavin-dependent oxidoreductase (luciferase family)
VEFGLVLSQFTDRWSHLESDALKAEECGLDSVWLADHLLSTGDPALPVFEAWTALGYVAAVTERVRLGHLVNCVSFRNPGLLAKMAVTLDHASGGRLEIGLGAGWFGREYEAFGYEFPSPGERRAYFEEYLDALLLLLGSRSPVDYSGRYVVLDRAVCNPGALQDPHPPIVIGTGGRLMRQVTGRKADVWNCPAGLLGDVRGAREVVMEAAAGREVRTTIQVPVAVGRTRAEAEAALELARNQLAWMGDAAEVGIAGTLDEAEAKVSWYQDQGADGLTAVLPGSRQRPDFIEAYGELAARF